MTPFNTIEQKDCLDLLKQHSMIPLVIADPPYNIGYKYQTYDDNLSDKDYLLWCEKWIAETQTTIKRSGTFWLFCNDKYAAELLVICKKYFILRRWIIWYYTFGVNQKRNFTPSHTHIFYLTRSHEFTFNEHFIPSARQLVYKDKRASKGRYPDDVWCLLKDEFPTDYSTDVWLDSRIAGTFNERSSTSNQIPISVIKRIILYCSNENDTVLDPFCGSGTTAKAAKILKRNYITADICPYAIEAAKKRIYDPL